MGQVRQGEAMATTEEDRSSREQWQECPLCGHVSEDARYCAECGHALHVESRNEEPPTAEQPPLHRSPSLGYSPPPHDRGRPDAEPAAPRSRPRIAAVAGVSVLVVVLVAVAVIVVTSGSSSGASPQTAYRQKLTAAFAPVIAANTALSSTLQGLHGSNTAAASRAANQAQQSVSAARGAMSVLAVPGGSQQLSQQAQQALADESGYLAAAGATLSSPSPGSIAQLQPLATSLQSAFVPLGDVASGGGSSVNGASSLSSWASSRVAAAAAAARAAERKQVQQAASKAAQQAVANSTGTNVSPPSAPSFGVESLPAQCGYGVAGSAGVSCGFAENAFYEYWNATGGNSALPANISAWSAEGQAYYALSCGSGDGVVDCTGTNASGVFLDVRFTQAAVSAYSSSQAASYAASGKPGPSG